MSNPHGRPAGIARAFCRSLTLALALVTLTACAVGPYADTPTYTLPKTRTTAARQLNEALAFDAAGVSQVAADELKLTWHEYRSITAKQKLLIDRQLDFQKIYSIARPEKPAELWELNIYAAGGTITFSFREGPDASKAEAALRRLQQPLTEQEERGLAKKYLRVLNNEAPQYLKKDGHVVGNPDWVPIADAIESLRLLTRQDFSNDEDREQEIKAWQTYLIEHYNL